MNLFNFRDEKRTCSTLEMKNQFFVKFRDQNSIKISQPNSTVYSWFFSSNVGKHKVILLRSSGLKFG